MANIKSAKKRARQDIKKRNHNMTLRSSLRTILKKVLSAINEKDLAKAKEAFKLAVPQIDKMSTKGMIHKNRAAKYKSKLNSKIKSLS
ncbi:MAG: 30S ribosomal protein S20 [Gammaproteobacteria bacterium TMED78]|nr:MAG: 30S ribosomal protein S20 [Gammaproteobacteria bacterium TMED78]